MFCTNCGAKNRDNSIYCSKCGNKLEIVIEKVEEFERKEKKRFDDNNKKVNKKVDEVKEDIRETEEKIKEIKEEIRDNKSEDFFIETEKNQDELKFVFNKKKAHNNFEYYKNCVINPVTENERVLTKVDTLEEAGSLAFKNALVAMIVNFLIAWIAFIFVKQMDADGTFKTIIDVSRWRDFDYFKYIFVNLVVFVIMIVLVSFVYYLATLVIKKDVKYERILVICANAFIPFVFLVMIVSRLAFLISNTFGVVVAGVGFIYTMLIMISDINSEIKLKNKNEEIYFHTACLGMFILLMTLFGNSWIVTSFKALLK